MPHYPYYLGIYFFLLSRDTVFGDFSTSLQPLILEAKKLKTQKDKVMCQGHTALGPKPNDHSYLHSQLPWLQGESQLHLSSPLTQSYLGSRCVSSNIVLLTQAFRKKFVIPDFEEFTGHVDRIFEDAKELTGGKVRAKGLREGQGLGARYTLLRDFLGWECNRWEISRTSKNGDKGFMYFFFFFFKNFFLN